MSHLSPDTLWALARGSLAAAEAKQAQEHLSTCAACAGQLSTVRAAVGVVATPTPVPPLRDEQWRRIEEGLFRAVDEELHAPWWRRLGDLFSLRPWGYVALAAAAAALLVVLWRSVPAEQAQPLADAPKKVEPAPAVPAPPVPTPVEKPRRAVVASARRASVAEKALVEAGTTVSTERGGELLLSLPDGSEAALQSAARVRVAALEPSRVALELERGALVVDAVHDSERVLTVKAGEVEVTDLGTRFLVERIGPQVIVAVQEGRVEARYREQRRTVGVGESAIFGERAKSPTPAPSPPAVPAPRTPAAHVPLPGEDDFVPYPGPPGPSAPGASGGGGATTSAPGGTISATDAGITVQGEEDKAPSALESRVSRFFQALKDLKRDVERRVPGPSDATVGPPGAPSAEEQRVAALERGAQEGACEDVLKLTRQWLAGPPKVAEPELSALRRRVLLVQARCFERLGKMDEAAKSRSLAQ